jgi:hypothetical protein
MLFVIEVQNIFLLDQASDSGLYSFLIDTVMQSNQKCSLTNQFIFQLIDVDFIENYLRVIQIKEAIRTLLPLRQ